MKFDKEQILAQLQRIVNSKTFAKTAINVKLLSFLVHASLDEKEVKEVTIGAEMFGKKYDPVKNDNKVRVYVYHLRKKLEQYYSEEAGKGEILFIIAKGQYRVQFSDQKEKGGSNYRRITIGITGIVLLAVIVYAFIYLGFYHKKQNLFWTENFKKNYPTMVIIGDHYTISAPIETGGAGVIRDFSINSDADFNTFIQKHPGKATSLTPNSFSYITKMGAFCCKDIGKYFNDNELDFELILSSEWDKAKINSQNIVFAGQAKTMRILKNVLEEHFPNFRLDHDIVIRTNPETSKEKVYSDTSMGEMIDYTIVANITGPAGNTHKFFISDHDGGVISSVRYFTCDDSVQEFYKRHQIGDSDFIALFKVTGWERTGYKMELELIDIKEN